MNFKLPNAVSVILNIFTKAGYQIYIVGGAVRDLLMSREVRDWDFTTDAKPEEILKLFPEGFYDNKFGTVGVPTSVIPSVSEESLDSFQNKSGDSSATPQNDRNQIFEITTMRQEGKYTDFRHPGAVIWTNKIEEDLARRDFTVNAIALTVTGSDPDQDPTLNITDPFSGQKDIESGIIRTVGDPNARFQEDALRLIRAIRIATELNFDIDDDTFKAIHQNAHLIKEIAWERIRDELFKLLASVNPYIGIVKLREAGSLQIVLPELEKCFGIVQEGPKHDRVYDIGEHSLLSLKFTPSNNALVRLAALLHDVGKPETIAKASDGNVTFYNHDIVGGSIARKIASRFNLSRIQTEKLYCLVRWHLFTVDERQTDSAIRRFIKNVGVENIDDIMAVRVGDRLGGGTKNAVSWRMEKFKERIKAILKKPFSISDLKINGNDVMKVLNIKPSKKVGVILQKLFEEVLEDSSKNTREYLMEKSKILNS